MAIKGYSLSGIKLLGASPLLLPQLTERTINPKVSPILNSGAGRPSPSYLVVGSVQPDMTFTLTDIARFFGAVSPISGLGIGTGLTYTGVEAQYEKKVDLGSRGGALTGRKKTSSKAFLIPQTLELRQWQEARLTALLVCLSTDGISSPLSDTDLITVDQCLATEKFTLGPVKINGTVMGGVDSVTIDFGITLSIRGESGNPYPSYATIDEVSPRATIRTSNIDLADTYVNSGTNLSSGATIYVRKYQTAGITYPDASAVHSAFVFQPNQGVVLAGTETANGFADATKEFMLHALEGSSAIVGYTANTAIT